MKHSGVAALVFSVFIKHSEMIQDAFLLPGN